ncbi:unnamed protein product [Closterium sp. Naga37s-1]|nr:unnamed protein product [Closterium sp. Naga37s-1]
MTISVNASAVNDGNESCSTRPSQHLFPLPPCLRPFFITPPPFVHDDPPVRYFFSAASNGQHSPSLNLAGRVAEFEGELNYYLPERFRIHPERVSLVIRPLRCPVDTSRLSNVFMGFFEHLPHRNAERSDLSGAPIKPVSASDSACASDSNISHGGSGDGPSGSSNDFSGGSLEDSTGNVTSAAAANSVSEERVSEGSVSGESEWQVKLGCHGPPCPSFGSCTARFPNVQACWNPHLMDEPETEIAPPINCPLKGDSAGQDKGRLPFDETCSHQQDFTPHGAHALQMMRLENVFVTNDGLALNRSHLFVQNGCARFPGTAVRALWG